MTGVASFPVRDAATMPIAQFPDILHIRKGKPNGRHTPPTGNPASFSDLPTDCWVWPLPGFSVSELSEKSGRDGKAMHLIRNRSPSKILSAKSVREWIGDEFYHSTNDAFSLWQEENPDAPEEIRSLVADMKAKCETVLYSNDSDTDSAPVSTVEANEFIKVLKKLPTRR